ncbi:uncharacterized protein TM35_000312060 [Trypanosoma theileri]|uniref:Uncharacterized protein n=1 Tax=Trypanosoma theileri TaxID=67003 RepID=A0A1X0NPF6_9TRYP|nr:uncharacterized protein TM35_000312060 [Trypanosoma theileri]ORC86020.1 hypothetical protein TM35_000312060 [Trypanosoma theileri]
MGVVCVTPAKRKAVLPSGGNGLVDNGTKVEPFPPLYHTCVDGKYKQREDEEQEQREKEKKEEADNEKRQSEQKTTGEVGEKSPPPSPLDCKDISSVLFLSYLMNTEVFKNNDVETKRAIKGLGNSTTAVLTSVITEETTGKGNKEKKKKKNNNNNTTTTIYDNRNGVLKKVGEVGTHTKEVNSHGKKVFDVATTTHPLKRDNFFQPSSSITTDDPAMLTHSVDCSDSLFAAGEHTSENELKDTIQQSVLDLVKRNFTKRLPYHLLPYLFRALTLQTVTRMIPGSMITPQIILECHIDIKGERPSTATPIDLDTLRQKIPKILHYRILAFRESQIAKALAAQNNTENPHESSKIKLSIKNEMETREGVNSCKDSFSRRKVVEAMSRSTNSNAILFGAVLPQDVVRTMWMGPHLFLPKATNVIAKSGCSLSSTQNDTCNISSSAVCSRFFTTTESVNAAASYEMMPSLFLKIGHSQRMIMRDRNKPRRLRRHEVRPMFKREFLATLVSGYETLCTYATTMLPEFLVGLKTFPAQPRQAIVSALRATLHRMNDALAREILHHDVITQSNDRPSLRAPPMDVSVVYLREDSLYYTSTPGMMGTLFIFTDNTQRVYAELKDCVDTTGNSPNTLGVSRDILDESVGASSITSSTRCVAVKSRRAYELPETPLGVIDLSKIRGVLSCMASAESSPDKLMPMGYRLVIAQSISQGRSEISDTQTSSTMASPLRCIGNSQPRSREQQQQQQEHKLIEEVLPSPEEIMHADILLPHVMISAVAEFWSAISPAAIWELLRWMLLLDRDAANTTMQSVENNTKDKISGTTTTTTTTATATATRATTMKYLSALRASTSIHPGTKRRLEQFYKKRVSHYVALDTLYTMTPQQVISEAMQKSCESEVPLPVLLEQDAPSAEYLTAGDSLGNAMAIVLATAVREQWPLWVNHSEEEKKLVGSASCAVMVVVIPQAVAATIK